MRIPDKIKKEYRLRIEAFEGLSFDKSLFIDEGLLKEICEISSSIGYEIALLIDRKGNVVDVIVGDKHTVSFSIDSSENRLSGLRVVHTHPNAGSSLSNMDLSFLKNNNMDCVAAVSIKDGMPYDMQVGYISGNGVNIVKCHNADYANKYGLIDKIFEAEKDFKEYYSNLNKLPEQRAILVKVAIKQKGNIEGDLDELEGLATTAHIEVVGRVSQFRVKPDGTYFIGSGKIDELRDLIQLNEANLIIFDNELSGSKVSNISNALGVKVIDRSMLILDIFASRARTNEGKLQVELAQLKYSLPRLGAYLESSGRYGGGVGMRGPGETKLELNRRIVEQNIVKKTEELKKLSKHRELNRKSRRENSKPTVSIVGYTNSGKSTLLNLIAKADVYVKNELFATLDTTTRNVWLGYGKEILCTDTVGFINNLPHEFVEAFASTLEESVFADLILHVVDASNNEFKNHINVTNKVLQGLGCNSPVLMVFNKIDNLESDEIDTIKIEYPNAVFISAKQSIGIEELKEKIISVLF
ncbi:MAG: GTPase HflX [Clostridia bacterium]|nr:GTPase HflX [Clostridia bacterium]